MGDLPISFSAPMVKAILREIEAPGTGKTQTRRVIKLQPPPTATSAGNHSSSKEGITNEWMWLDGDPRDCETWGALDDFRLRYAPGDRLYVREHWRCSEMHDATASRDLIPRSMTIAFEAGGSIANQDSRDDWRPSSTSYEGADWMGRFRHAMHMHRWASRLTLTVTDVRVQRLQEISEADAKAEGCDATLALTIQRPNGAYPGNVRETFHDLWNSLHGPDAWAANLWVAAYHFRPILGNIDQIEKGRADG